MQIPSASLFAILRPGYDRDFNEVFTDKTEAQAEADRRNEQLKTDFANSPWHPGSFQVLTLDAALGEIYRMGKFDGENPGHF